MMMWPLIIWMFGLLMIFVTIDAYQHVRYKRYDQVPEHCPRRDKPAYEECQQKLVKKWNLPIKQMVSGNVNVNDGRSHSFHSFFRIQPHDDSVVFIGKICNVNFK